MGLWLRHVSGLPAAGERMGSMEGDPQGVTGHDGLRFAEGLGFLVLFCLTIPAANWLIGHIGTECASGGPCLIPVAPGLLAPSGVLMVGAALVLRDLVQRRFGAGVG